MYHIVGEIKSDNTAALSQNVEQMVGLFGFDQKMMLGLVVWPEKIQPQIPVRKGDALELNRMQELSLANDCVQETLCDISIALLNIKLL